VGTGTTASEQADPVFAKSLDADAVAEEGRPLQGVCFATDGDVLQRAGFLHHEQVARVAQRVDREVRILYSDLTNDCRRVTCFVLLTEKQCVAVGCAGRLRTCDRGRPTGGNAGCGDAEVLQQVSTISGAVGRDGHR
jgi:hypothetical protein